MLMLSSPFKPENDIQLTPPTKDAQSSFVPLFTSSPPSALKFVVDDEGKASLQEFESLHMDISQFDLSTDQMYDEHTVYGSSPCPVSIRRSFPNSSFIMKTRSPLKENGNINPQDTLICQDAKQQNACDNDDYFINYEFLKRRIMSSESTIDSDKEVYEPCGKRRRIDFKGNSIPLKYKEIEVMVQNKTIKTTNIRRSKCCNHYFTNALDFASHLDNVHEQNFREYACPHINCVWSVLGFNLTSDCQRHWNQVHEKPTHECLICDRVFTRPDVLKRHIKRVHK